MEDVSFDAADLADAILGTPPSPNAPISPSVAPAALLPPRGTNALGWMLLVILLATVAVAISLAVQTTPSRGIAPEPTPCGGLYDTCCDPRPLPDQRGLFDAEDDFARERDCVLSD